MLVGRTVWDGGEERRGTVCRSKWGGGGTCDDTRCEVFPHSVITRVKDSLSEMEREREQLMLCCPWEKWSKRGGGRWLGGAFKISSIINNISTCDQRVCIKELGGQERLEMMREWKGGVDKSAKQDQTLEILGNSFQNWTSKLWHGSNHFVGMFICCCYYYD